MKRAGLLMASALLLLTATGLAAEDKAAVPPNQETEHVVAPGETLGGIAVRAEVPRVLIIEANGLKPPYGLRAGQKLLIPRTRHHTVIRGETGFTIAYNYGVPWRDIAVANGLDTSTALTPGQRLLIPTVLKPPVVVATANPQPSASATPAPRFAWPLAGTVRRGFKARGTPDYHDGLDIRAAEGVAVRAAAAGKVIFAGNDPRQFGNLVVVEHPGGWQTSYAFLSRITVKDGEDVGAGERVGLVGHTGMARGSELHFELRKEERAVDPAAHLPRR